MLPPPSPCPPASPPPHHQESVVSAWVDQGTMSQVQQNKLVFIETQDFVETTVALENYIKVKDQLLLQLHSHSNFVSDTIDPRLMNYIL